MAVKKSPEKEIASKLYRDYLSGQRGEEVPPSLQTREYRLFAQKKNAAVTLYEKFAKLSGKIYKYPVSKDMKKEYDAIFETFNYNLKAEDAMSFAILSFVFLMLSGVGALFISMLLAVVLMIASLLSFVFFRTYPRRLINIRRSRASTEIVLSVLYIVIYMKNVPNLEAAVKFAAENLDGPLSVDYAKMLWDVSVKRYVDIKEALDAYLQQWKKYNEAFVDSIYLVETSLVQKEEERRIALLDQALSRILDGTYEAMVHYVNGLRTPVSAVFMLGITLPIMGLVMLPLIGAFLGDLLTPMTVIVLYDIILPSAVLLMILYILATRPSAFPEIKLGNHPEAPPRYHFLFFGRPIHAAIPSVILFILLMAPYIWYAFTTQDLSKPSESDVIYSLFSIVALGFPIALFCKLSSKKRLQIRKKIKGVENDFAYAVFQIGNRLSEGVPAEIAMMKTAATMKQSNVSFFIHKISDNMQKLGMDLYRAIFDKTYGALILYPSSLIRSVMKIFVESTRESEEVAAAALMHIGNYLQSVHKIEEKIKDVLSETLSTLKFQTSFIAPLISGIIVGLTSMILIILSSLGTKIGAVTGAAGAPTSAAGGAESGLGGAVAFGFFEMSSTIPLPLFQIVVGVYLVQIVIISMILASRIEHGEDNLALLDEIQRALFISVTIYFIVAAAVTIGFAGMAKIAIAIGEF